MAWVRREYQCESGDTWSVIEKKEDEEQKDICPKCGLKVTHSYTTEVMDLPFIMIEPASSINKNSGKVQRENHYSVSIMEPDCKLIYRTRFFYSWPDAVKLMEVVRKMPRKKLLKFLTAGKGK